ncbi:MAG TPA: ORF6N domain-containing protein [Burkholderiales bacterium]|nr:ORF6N domain-containing protein [Burkholderiales bacterium]
MADGAVVELAGIRPGVGDERFPVARRDVVRRDHAVVIARDLAHRREVDREFENLRYQFGTSRWGGRRYRPYAFTEQGVAMLSSVLRSPRAVRANIEIMRAFVRLRAMLASHDDLARKLAALEKKYDAQFKVVFDAICQLMTPPEPSWRPIGFGTWR